MKGEDYMASSCGTDIDKASLRVHQIKARDAQDAEARRAADEKIFSHLAALDAFANAGLVLTYVSYRSEVDTRRIIESLLAEGRRVAVPRCDKKAHTMSFFELSSFDDLEPGAHNILEPKRSLVDAVRVPQMVGSACLVPGLIFDAAGHRLGYGGGYYDRFLAFYPGEKVGLARSGQISCNLLPQEPTDVPLDYVVTETGAWSCR